MKISSAANYKWKIAEKEKDIRMATWTFTKMIKALDVNAMQI